MRLDDCFELGHIQKPHGLKGELSIFLDTDFPEDYEDLGSVFVLDENGLVPFFMEYIQLTSDQKAIVKFEDIDTFDGCTARMLTYTGCDAINMVQLLVVDDGGHSWPGSANMIRIGHPYIRPINNDIDASQIIWEFFEQHSL